MSEAKQKQIFAKQTQHTQQDSFDYSVASGV